jgi:hypothetical protein
MRSPGIAIIVLAFLYSAAAQGQPAPPLPDHFEIGRHTFFDFGPPNDFYEVFLVRAAANGTAVEKITLTPAGYACVQTAEVEVATGALAQSVGDLFGKTNPCAIPEKGLHRELKRCKNCLVFSGANVTMQVQCGSQTRIIRADILDRDMFGSAPNTPKHTSWIMQLLARLDQATGPGVMDRPMFSIPGDVKKKAPTQGPETLQDVSVGKYDGLFQGAPDKPSDLYRAAQIPPPTPTIRLVSSTPSGPETFVEPVYLPIARLARIEGAVSFTVDINSDGEPTNFTATTGHPMLRGATEEAVSKWKFSKGAAGQRVQAVVEFATNCPAKKQ